MNTLALSLNSQILRSNDCIAQARNLQAYGELPASARINQTAVDMAIDGGDGQDEDVGFDFEDVSDGQTFHLKN